MVTNPYFNNYNNSAEQDLMADLIEESIQMFGYDMIYLPRRAGNENDIFNSDDMSYFDTAYTIEMYIKNVEAFEGEGSFLSKFGLEVRDRVTLSVARRRFDTEVATPENTLNANSYHRPKEGDLVYFTMTKKLFEIKYVDNRAIFYPMGALPLFDITLEVFEYNNERFNTGVAEIDAIESDHSTDLVPHTTGGVVDPDFDPEEFDLEFDNNDFAEEVGPNVDYTIIDPFSKGNY